MTIDLNDIPIGVAESQREISMLKAGKLVKEIMKAKSDFDIVTMSVNIFNVLEYSDRFVSRSAHQHDGIFFVGDLYDLKVYVDVLMEGNKLVISYDTQKSRDNKIIELLEGNAKKKSIEITIL